MLLLMNMWLIGATTWLSHKFLLHVGYAIKSRNLFRTQGRTLWSSEESLIIHIRFKVTFRSVIEKSEATCTNPLSNYDITVRRMNYNCKFCLHKFRIPIL